MSIVQSLISTIIFPIILWRILCFRFNYSDELSLEFESCRGASCSLLPLDHLRHHYLQRLVPNLWSDPHQVRLRVPALHGVSIPIANALTVQWQVELYCLSIKVGSAPNAWEPAVGAYWIRKHRVFNADTFCVAFVTSRSARAHSLSLLMRGVTIFMQLYAKVPTYLGSL